MTQDIKKAEQQYWEQPDLKVQHELIAGPVKWDDAEKAAADHWDLLSKGVPLKDGDRVLEIGCGVGRILKWLAENKRYKLSGVDLSENMIARAWMYVGTDDIEFYQVKDEVLPMKDSSLEFVYSFLVFQHIPTRKRIQKYLSEIYRVLDSGGYVRIQTHKGNPHPQERYGYTHGSFYPSIEEFKKDFIAAGFTIESTDDCVGSNPQAHSDWLWVTAKK